MRYVIWARSPDTGPIQGEGTWVLDAADAEEAVRLLQQAIQFEVWPQGSTWMVRPWTMDDGDVESRMRLAKTA